MSAPVSMPSVHDVLVAAREVLQERGWTQGQAMDERGCVCALQAIETASGPGDAFEAAERALRRTLRGGSPRWFSVAEFNDHPSTREADIYALFDRAIAATEPQP